MIRVKVIAEYCGKHYALGIPAIIDSDGELTITYLQATAAAHMLRSEMHPETLMVSPIENRKRRPYRKKS